MKRKIEKIVNYALNVLIVVFSIILLITLYNSIQLKIFKNSYSNFFGYSVFEIQTNSMAKEIFADDWIIVKITKNVDVGDVITFDDNGKFLTHRIIEKYGETYITKGDANNSKDEPIDKSQIVGEVSKILPRFGLIRKTLFDTQVLLALIGFLFIISFLFKNNKTSDTVEEESNELYTFGRDKKEDSYISKLTKSERITVNDREEIESDEEPEEQEIINDENEIYSFYDEKKSLFKKKKNQIKEEELTDEKSDDVIESIEEATVDDINEISEEETNEVEETIEEVESTEEDETEETTEEEVETDETEETTEEERDHSTIQISLDEEELNIVNKPVEIEEEKPAVIEDTFEPDEIDIDDPSIITVELDEIEKPIEEPKKKKTVPKGEDIYKNVNQDIEIELKNLDPIEQVSDTEITVYEDEIKRTEKEIEQYKSRINVINGEKEAIDLDIKTKHDKEIKDEEDRLAKIEFDRLEAKKLTHISLDNLSKRHYKTKNIIDKIMQLKTLKLETLINLLNNGEEQVTNEPTIKDELENTYNNVMYYNYFEVKDNKKIDVELINKADNLIKSYKGNDKHYEEKVNKNLSYLLLIAKLELNNKKTAKERNDYFKNILTKYSKNLDWPKEMIPYIIKEYKEIQSTNLEQLETILKEIDTKTFKLELKKVNKNMFAANLEHNVAFDKFYSDFVIDATYNSSIIKEDKMNVLIQLLMTNFLKEMLVGDFNNDYLLYLPNSLYSKKTKLNTLIKSINDKYVKDHTIITMDYNIFIKNRKTIREYKKHGYKFGVYMDFESDIQEKYTKSFGLIDYIFINPEQKTTVTKNIPNDYFERIILSDITSLLDDYEEKGGE